MANNFKLAHAASKAAVEALGALANAGFLDIYDSTQPTNPDTAIGAQVKLASLGMNATAFGAAANGVITANAITQDSSADATGTATWFRMYKTDHTTAICDGSVGTSGCDLNLVTTAIVATQPVQISSLTITLPEA